MKCTHCGQPVADGVQFCGSCGQPIISQAPPQQAPVPTPQPPLPPQQPSASPLQAGPGVGSASPVGAPMPGGPVYGSPQTPGQNNPYAGQVSDKSYLTTFLLAYFLGVFGADRFYTKETGLGVLKLITLGGCGLWALLDTILVLAGVRKDKFGRELFGRDKDFKTSLIIFIIFSVLSVVGNIINVLLSSSGSGY